MDYLTKAELYELLDIDVPSDFQYFENLAALLECENEIDSQVLAQLLDGVDKKILAELLNIGFIRICIQASKTMIHMNGHHTKSYCLLQL